jgi:hypothetical protein
MWVENMGSPGLGRRWEWKGKLKVMKEARSAG